MDCPACSGRGFVNSASQVFDGRTGEPVSEQVQRDVPCEECGGTGVAPDSSNWQIRIEALGAAVQLIASDSGSVEKISVQATLDLAKRFERYLESGE